MVAIGVAPSDEIQVFLFTITHEFLELPCWGRNLGIKRQIGRTNNQTSHGLALIVFYLNCY
jgi:hypothetical protein